MLFSIDTDGRVIRVSDYWSEEFDYIPGEVLGRKFSRFLSDEKPGAPGNRHYASTAGNRPLPGRFIPGSSKKSGEVVNVLMTGIAEMNEDGKVDPHSGGADRYHRTNQGRKKNFGRPRKS